MGLPSNCLSLSLPVSLSTCLPVSLSACLTLYLSLSACLAVSLSACLTVYLSLSLPISLSTCLSLSAFLTLYLSLSLPVSLLICLSLPVSLSLSLPVLLSTCLSLCLSHCLPVSLSACLTVYLSLSLPVSLSLSLPVILSTCLSFCLSHCLPLHPVIPATAESWDTREWLSFDGVGYLERRVCCFSSPWITGRTQTHQSHRHCLQRRPFAPVNGLRCLIWHASVVSWSDWWNDRAGRKNNACKIIIVNVGDVIAVFIVTMIHTFNDLFYFICHQWNIQQQ